MRHRTLVVKLIAIFLAIFGSTLIVLAGLPYPGLRSVLDGLSPDGVFNSMKPWNAGVFRVLLAAGGIGFLALAGLTFFQRWGRIGLWLQKLWTDSLHFFRLRRPQKNELGFLAALVLIMALAVILRLERVQWTMTHDEAYTFAAFGQSLFSALSDYHLPNNHVFHSILVYFSTHLFGIAPWAVRLPAFTAGVLLIPAVYWMAKRFHDRWTALGAAFLAAWFRPLIDYSDSARGYTLVALFTVLTIALADVVRREKNLFAWLLMVLFSALGLFTVPVMLFPFGILYVWLFLENLSGDVVTGPGSYQNQGEFFSYWVVSGLVTAILTAFLYLPVLVYSGPQKLFSNIYVAPVAWSVLLETLSTRFGETWAQWTFRMAIYMIWVLAAGWLVALIFHKRLSRVKVPLQLAALLWITALILIQRPNAMSKVWVFLQPLMLMWAAAGIFGFLQKIRPRFLGGRPLGAAAAVGVLLVAGSWQAVRLVPDLPEIWARKGEEEKTVLLIQGQLQANELIAVAPTLDASIWYYSRLHGIPEAYFNSYTADYQRLIVLVYLPEGQTFDSVVQNRGFHLRDLETDSARLLATFESIQVFEVERK